MFLYIFFLEKTILYLSVLKYNCFELINDYYFLKKVFLKFFFKKKLILKLGIDPTNNIIHLGHTILLNKINQIDKLDFKVILILGNFTSLIGDPTNKIYLRNYIFKKKICLNISYFLCQLKFIINLNIINIYYNKEWFKVLNIFDLINLFYLITLNKILYRNDFKKRYDLKSPIFLSEIVYPIFQSFDSFFIKSDIEIGGFDQKLNFLITKFIQKKINNHTQILLLLNLLFGIDGFYKMSKSRFNFISYKDGFLSFYKKIFFSKNFFYYYLNIIFFKKKKIFFKKNRENFIFDLINIYFGDNLIYFLPHFFFIKIYKIKKKNKIIYNLIKSFFKNSNNKIISYIKNNSLKINNILIKNFNFFLLKGKYLIKIKNQLYFIFIF